MYLRGQNCLELLRRQQETELETSGADCEDPGRQLKELSYSPEMMKASKRARVCDFRRILTLECRG